MYSVCSISGIIIHYALDVKSYPQRAQVWMLWKIDNHHGWIVYYMYLHIPTCTSLIYCSQSFSDIIISDNFVPQYLIYSIRSREFVYHQYMEMINDSVVNAMIFIISVQVSI